MTTLSNRLGAQSPYAPATNRPARFGYRVRSPKRGIRNAPFAAVVAGTRHGRRHRDGRRTGGSRHGRTSPCRVPGAAPRGVRATAGGRHRHTEACRHPAGDRPQPGQRDARFRRSRRRARSRHRLPQPADPRRRRPDPRQGRAVRPPAARRRRPADPGALRQQQPCGCDDRPARCADRRPVERSGAGRRSPLGTEEPGAGRARTAAGVVGRRNGTGAVPLAARKPMCKLGYHARLLGYPTARTWIRPPHRRPPPRRSPCAPCC
jgi:hypothetical protein